MVTYDLLVLGLLKHPPFVLLPQFVDDLEETGGKVFNCKESSVLLLLHEDVHCCSEVSPVCVEENQVAHRQELFNVVHTLLSLLGSANHHWLLKQKKTILNYSLQIVLRHSMVLRGSLWNGLRVLSQTLYLSEV